jgi:hypothetical protein
MVTGRSSRIAVDATNASTVSSTAAADRFGQSHGVDHQRQPQFAGAGHPRSDVRIAGRSLGQAVRV